MRTGERDALVEDEERHAFDTEGARLLVGRGDGRARAAISAADDEARAMGVSGVPFFIFNNKVALSGAHEPETMLDAIAQSQKTETA